MGIVVRFVYHLHGWRTFRLNVPGDIHFRGGGSPAMGDGTQRLHGYSGPVCISLGLGRQLGRFGHARVDDPLPDLALLVPDALGHFGGGRACYAARRPD